MGEVAGQPEEPTSVSCSIFYYRVAATACVRGGALTLVRDICSHGAELSSSVTATIKSQPANATSRSRKKPHKYGSRGSLQHNGNESPSAPQPQAPPITKERGPFVSTNTLARRGAAPAEAARVAHATAGVYTTSPGRDRVRAAAIERRRRRAAALRKGWG